MGMAARMGDPTAHGGVIVVGFPMVLIGGMPAARIADMHVCPMVTGIVPHVGGPIAMGSPMVLIGGMPAARMGDMVICAGPPDTIMMGCPTVLIGEGGSGSGSGGGAGSSGAASAKAAAANALTDNVEASTKEEHWIEFEFLDKAENPVSGVPYKFEDTEKKESNSIVRSDGKIRRDALKEGEAKVQLFYVSNAKWSKDKAEVGEKVKMTADVDGFENGTKANIEIYKRDIKGADVIIENIEVEVKGKKVEAEWEYKYSFDEKDDKSEETKQIEYSSPEYYFVIILRNMTTRSGLLGYKDFIEIELRDENNNPIPNEDYILYFSNGEVRKGKLNGRGYRKEEKVPPGYYDIKFPNLTNLNNT